MLAFLATRICSKTQNGKSDIAVQTSEILSHAQKCPPAWNPWHVLSVNIWVAVAFNWALLCLATTPGESISLKHKYFLKIRDILTRGRPSLFGQHSPFIWQLLHWNRQNPLFILSPQKFSWQNFLHNSFRATIHARRYTRFTILAPNH